MSSVVEGFKSSHMEHLEPPASLFPKKNPLSIDPELWAVAEQRAQDIISTVQPSVASDKRREEIILHIKKLIKHLYGSKVFLFGSVPLKTYLPDGDIDLTVLCLPSMQKDFITNLCSTLRKEEQHAEFPVNNIEHVRAQVEIVKFNVEDIAVDISFNQIAGLSTLCFLEQVDKFIGRDHLFKRSVILIKTWCYYESRTLGAYYGLLSTYALETMVLYIISAFHSSLHGPLSVMYKFLDYYSRFDWNKYCVTINGPVAISSIRKTVATPSNGEDGLLLTQEFLRTCREKLSVPTMTSKVKGFRIKHVNILDPLQDNNNLGRSICQATFYRIKCAFAYGAKKLGKIVMHPEESFGAGLEQYFTHSLDRNGRGLRPDVPGAIPAFGTGSSEVSDLTGDYDIGYNNFLYSRWCIQNLLLLQPNSPLSPSEGKEEDTMMPSPIQPSSLDQNIFCCKGTEVFVPRIPFSHLDTSESSDATNGSEEIWRSRGTGTYIPDMSRIPVRNIQSRTRTRNTETSVRSIATKPPNKSYQTEIVNEKKKKTNDVFIDLSETAFPLLSDMKSTKSPEADQSTTESSQLKNPDALLGTIEFGSFKAKVPSDRLTVSASTSNGPSNGKQMEDEERNGNAKLSPLYHLDDKEFPTL